MAPYSSIISGLLDLVCPPRCLLCGRFMAGATPAEGLPGLCADCGSDLPALGPAFCRVCGLVFSSAGSGRHTCGPCLKKRPRFDQALAAGRFEDSLRRAIHAFKYNGRTELAAPLAAFMAAHLHPPFYPPRADLIMPVPLHPRRLRERGFNQALLLARALFENSPAIVPHVLRRTRPTVPQINLDGRQRRRNVKDAFSLHPPEMARDKAILLVDDVFTTGATANECARLLKRAGARSVLVLTLARAV